MSDRSNDSGLSNRSNPMLDQISGLAVSQARTCSMPMMCAAFMPRFLSAFSFLVVEVAGFLRFVKSK